MVKKSLFNQAGLIALLVMIFVFAVAPAAYAAEPFEQDKSVTITLINTATAFLIFVLGLRITYQTRGGFMSFAFVLITVGITIGWVAKLAIEFLADSSILSTTYDVVGIAESIGGITLAIGFFLLSEKFKD
jgi:hypothetical protein